MESVAGIVPNILVVDDVNANLVVLVEIIRKAGYIARPVTSVKQAMAAINALLPDLILTDVSMPDMNGFEFCSLLKKNLHTSDIPVIFVTAMNSMEDKIRGFKEGAVDYIVKPFSSEEVTLRINTHLKLHKMQMELEAYNRKLYKIINEQIGKIYEGQRNIIYAMAKISAIRDGNNGMHLDNVGKSSRILAISLQLSSVYENEVTNHFIDTLELASPLHDIGKAAIPDSILMKDSALEPEEKKIMQSHTEIGARMLEEIYSNSKRNDFLKMAINIARYHHEKWDGTGYPEGLSGTDIPLCARIVSLVNAYDILANQRCYKPAYSHERCMKIINEEAGTRFDPFIVQNFNKIQKQIQKNQ